MILLFLTLSIIANGIAQELETKEIVEKTAFPANDEERMQKQQESIEALMKEVGDMGMMLESYRRVIVNGIRGSNDICGIIESLTAPNNLETIDSKYLLLNLENLNKLNILSKGTAGSNNDLGINLYKQFFREINDPIMKTQIFATLENHIDDCFNNDERNELQKPGAKRDKSQMQKIRFHSWGKN